MPLTRLRRNRTPALLRRYRDFAAPCLLVVVIIIFGVAEKRSAKSVNRTSQIAGGTVVKSDEVARNRAYIRYRIPARGRRYFLGSLAERFDVPGGWRKIAETTLKHNGKEVNEKAISDFQFQLEAGQEVLIPY